MNLTKILVPLFDPTHALPYLEMAAALLPPEGRILALKVVEIPEEDSLSVGAEKAPIYRAAMEELLSQFSDQRAELKTLVRVSHRLREGIVETVKEEGCDLLLLPWKGYSFSEDSFFGGTIDRLLEQPPCNSVVVRTDDFTNCKRILLPVRGGPYAEFALEVASQLALSLEAEVTVLHCEQRFSAPGFADRAYQSFLRKLQFHPHVKRLINI